MSSCFSAFFFFHLQLVFGATPLTYKQQLETVILGTCILSGLLLFRWTQSYLYICLLLSLYYQPFCPGFLSVFLEFVFWYLLIKYYSLSLYSNFHSSFLSFCFNFFHFSYLALSCGRTSLKSSSIKLKKYDFRQCTSCQIIQLGETSFERKKIAEKCSAVNITLNYVEK